jgi:hypothetical protein
MVIGQAAVRCPFFPHLIVNRETALTFCSCNPVQANRLNRFASDCNPIPSAGWPFLVSEGNTVFQGELTRGSPCFTLAVSVALKSLKKARGAALRTKRTVDPGVLAPYLWPVEQHCPPKQLSSGNPQIGKGDGDMPVQSYLDAMPGWKSRIGHQLDRIVAQVYPDVRKAVRWNTPLYGKEDGWFFSICCCKTFVQLSFFRGVDLVPVPPGRSKVEGVRYFKIHENDALDENLIAG